MTDITPGGLKAEAELALLDRRIDDTVLTGQQRKLTVLLMCTFACQITMRELKRQLDEIAS